MKATVPVRHAPRFADDVRDHKGRRYCACGRVETHPIHDPLPAPEAARERDAAVLGEGADDDD